MRGLPLALCLLTAGCALRRNPPPVTSQPTTDLPGTKTAQRPPEPAPSLRIPGSSVAAKPTSTVKEPLVTIVPPEQGQVSPLTPGPLPKPPDPDEEAKDRISPLQQLYDQAAQRFEQTPCYELRLRRREVVGNQPKPEENIACRFRQEPYSLHFKWLGPEAKNREVIYVKGRHDNLIHTLTAAGDVFLLPGGKHFKVAPDSAMVRSRSRYPITEAAVGAWIVKFGRLAEAIDKNLPTAGTAKVLGELKRPEFDEKVIAVLHKIPAGWEPLLPQGGQRLWFFDPQHHLPVLIITNDETGREVEYYCMEQYCFNVPMTDDDFDPERLWKR
jgi:hypothetical protein